MAESSLTLQSICTPSENIVARKIEGEIVIVPLVSGIGDADDELYTLNPTGQAIWQKMDGSHTLAQIVEELSTEYHSTRAEIEQDILGLVGELVRRKMVVAH
ncbi:MAG: PqqD family protein [Anaerolineales bacterium]